MLQCPWIFTTLRIHRRDKITYSRSYRRTSAVVGRETQWTNAFGLFCSVRADALTSSSVTFPAESCMKHNAPEGVKESSSGITHQNLFRHFKNDSNVLEPDRLALRKSTEASIALILQETTSVRAVFLDDLSLFLKRLVTGEQTEVYVHRNLSPAVGRPSSLRSGR